jgi:hypothetical protein
MLDIKRIWKTTIFGDNDLQLYGEIALIGLKNYPAFYEDRSERMPFMLGFCLPTFDFLDRLSLEVEYFTSPYRNDYRNIRNFLDPCPVSWQQYTAGSDTTFSPDDDNFKWSVDLKKAFDDDKYFINVRVANDHLRHPTELWVPPLYDLLTKPDDWYWYLKFGFVF